MENDFDQTSGSVELLNEMVSLGCSALQRNATCGRAQLPKHRRGDEHR